MALSIASPNEYAGPQRIISSGRVILHAATSDIILASAGTIALASDNEIHLNSKGDLRLNVKDGSKVKIGKIGGKRSEYKEIVLGPNLQSLIEDLFQLLTTFQVTTPSGNGNASPDVASKIEKLKKKYLKAKSADYILSDFVVVASNLK